MRRQRNGSKPNTAFVGGIFQQYRNKTKVEELPEQHIEGCRAGTVGVSAEPPCTAELGYRKNSFDVGSRAKNCPNEACSGFDVTLCVPENSGLLGYRKRLQEELQAMVMNRSDPLIALDRLLNEPNAGASPMEASEEEDPRGEFAASSQPRHQRQNRRLHADQAPSQLRQCLGQNFGCTSRDLVDSRGVLNMSKSPEVQRQRVFNPTLPTGRRDSAQIGSALSPQAPCAVSKQLAPGRGQRGQFDDDDLFELLAPPSGFAKTLGRRHLIKAEQELQIVLVAG